MYKHSLVDLHCLNYLFIYAFFIYKPTEVTEFASRMHRWAFLRELKKKKKIDDTTQTISRSC